jgi:hypothetical protein
MEKTGKKTGSAPSSSKSVAKCPACPLGRVTTICRPASGFVNCMTPESLVTTG